MPNLAATLIELDILAGGPGSGRKPTFIHKTVQKFTKDANSKTTQQGIVHHLVNGVHVATTTTRMENVPVKKVSGRVSVFKNKKQSITNFNRSAIASISSKDEKSIPQTYNDGPLKFGMNLSKQDIERRLGGVI